MRTLMSALITTALSFVTFTGCANAPARVGRGAIAWSEIKQTHGVLLLSAGSSETCALATNVVIKESRTRTGHFDTKNPTLSPQNLFLSSDFDHVRSRVYALALNPGEYDYALLAVNYIHMEDPVTVQRTVQLDAGEIVYAGEIWLENCRYDVSASIRDSWDRDRPLIEAKFPLLPLDQVQIRLFR